MKKRKFSHWFSFSPADIKGEITTLPSAFVPNQTMGIKEIISRFTSGQTVYAGQPVYLGETEVPSFEMMDEVEKMEYAQKHGKKLLEIRRAVNANQKAFEEMPKVPPVDGEPVKRVGGSEE